MKKIATLLTAFLLFCLPAHGEAYRMAFNMSVSEETTLRAITDELAAVIMEMMPEVNRQSLSDFLYHAATETAVEILYDEDSAKIDLMFCGYPLMDMSCHVVGRQMALTSTLIPGYAIMLDLPVVPEGNDKLLSNQLTAADVVQPVMEWANSLACTEQVGSFSGDAYDGGAVCTTYMLQEADLLTLLETILNTKNLTAITPLLAAGGLNGYDILDAVSTLKQSVADTSYDYIVRIVKDEAGHIIGVSMTVMREHVQIATLSVGGNEQEMHAVLGLGFAQENYWFELNFSGIEGDVIRTDILHFREFRAPKDETFSYTAAYAAPETHLSWAFTSYRANGMDVLNIMLMDELSGSQIGLCSERCEEPYMQNIYTTGMPIRFGYSLMQTEDTIQELSRDLTIVTNCDADSEQFELVLNNLITRFSARLLKVVPADLLLQLQ